jgi:hypothetical protein
MTYMRNYEIATGFSEAGALAMTRFWGVGGNLTYVID